MQLRRKLEQDNIRTPLQTAAAVLLAYAAMSLLGLSDITWGTFSAVFVVQTSVGGTIGVALRRVAGAVIGALIAIALIAIWGTGEWRTVAALFVGVAIMGVIAARWSALGYGLVTVTVIIVAPDFSVIEGALRKILAIAIGSGCGMVAAMLLFPVSAHRSAQRNLTEAIRFCGELFSDCIACLLDEKPPSKTDTERRIDDSLYRARRMSGQARIDTIPKSQANNFCETMIREIDRFRYTLTLIDRFSDQSLSESVCQRHAPVLKNLAEAGKSHLLQTADAMAEGQNGLDMSDVWRCYYTFSENVEHSVQQSEVDRDDREHLMAIKGACRSILMNMDQLTKRLNDRNI